MCVMVSLPVFVGLLYYSVYKLVYSVHVCVYGFVHVWMYACV